MQISRDNEYGFAEVRIYGDLLNQAASLRGLVGALRVRVRVQVRRSGAADKSGPGRSDQ